MVDVAEAAEAEDVQHMKRCEDFLCASSINLLRRVSPPTSTHGSSEEDAAAAQRYENEEPEERRRKAMERPMDQLFCCACGVTYSLDAKEGGGGGGASTAGECGGGGVCPALDEDVLRVIANVYITSLHPHAFAVGCAVCKTWRSAFDPKESLRKIDTRLRERIEELKCDELLRRPMAWRRRRELCDGVLIEPSNLAGMHQHARSLVDAFYRPNEDLHQPQPVMRVWIISVAAFILTDLLSESDVNQVQDVDSWQRQLHEAWTADEGADLGGSAHAALFAQQFESNDHGIMALRDGAEAYRSLIEAGKRTSIRELSARRLAFARKCTRLEWFQLGVPVHGPHWADLARWTTSIVDEADFFSSERDARRRMTSWRDWRICPACSLRISLRRLWLGGLPFWRSRRSQKEEQSYWSC